MYRLPSNELAQRFILELLTEIESIYFLPHRGTSFIQRCKKARTEFDVIVAFLVVKKNLKNNLKEDEDYTVPRERRYKDSKIERIKLINNILSIDFRIITKSDDSVYVTTPDVVL